MGRNVFLMVEMLNAMDEVYAYEVDKALDMFNAAGTDEERETALTHTKKIDEQLRTHKHNVKNVGGSGYVELMVVKGKHGYSICSHYPQSYPLHHPFMGENNPFDAESFLYQAVCESYMTHYPDRMTAKASMYLAAEALDELNFDVQVVEEKQFYIRETHANTGFIGVESQYEKFYTSVKDAAEDGKIIQDTPQNGKFITLSTRKVLGFVVHYNDYDYYVTESDKYGKILVRYGKDGVNNRFFFNKLVELYEETGDRVIARKIKEAFPIWIFEQAEDLAYGAKTIPEWDMPSRGNLDYHFLAHLNGVDFYYLNVDDGVGMIYMQLGNEPFDHSVFSFDTLKSMEGQASEKHLPPQWVIERAKRFHDILMSKQQQNNSKE